MWLDAALFTMTRDNARFVKLRELVCGSCDVSVGGDALEEREGLLEHVEEELFELDRNAVLVKQFVDARHRQHAQLLLVTARLCVCER